MFQDNELYVSVALQYTFLDCKLFSSAAQYQAQQKELCIQFF